MGTPVPSGKPSRHEDRPESSSGLSESVLILRAAQGMVVPLRTSSDVGQPVLPIPVRTKAPATEALAVPFRVSRRLTDRETGKKFDVALAVESSAVPDRLTVTVACDPIPKGQMWKLSLQDAGSGDELAGMPMRERQEVLDRNLPYGFYVVELSSDGHSLCRFPFTIEPFSLPEALDAAEEYLAHSQYGRAIAVLEDAGARYADSAEVWDLLSVVEELATLDPEAVAREEEQEFGVFRGPREWFRGARSVLQKVRSKFGESVASLLVARKLEPESVPDALLSSVTELPVSLPALRALALMEERLKGMGDETKLRDERLEQALAGVTGRLEKLETLTLNLGERVDAIRADVGRDAEEKFSLVGELLIRFLDGTRSAGVSLPDFAPFFQEKLGQACWKWIGRDAQKMFVSAEDVYRYFAGSATAQSRDFTPALLEFCRGFELLLNFRLVKLCDAVRNVINGNRQLQDFVDQELTWANLNDTIKFKKSYTIPQVAIALRLAQAVRQRYPELLGKDVTSLLASSGLSDHESISVLSHIGLIFRNGKVHPYPGSKRMFTSPEEVRILRKLLFGLDEERVESNAFFWELHELRGFSKTEIRAAADSLSHDWSHFPGLVPRLWRTAEIAAAA